MTNKPGPKEWKFGSNLAFIFASVLILIGVVNLVYLMIGDMTISTQIVLLYGLSIAWCGCSFYFANRKGEHKSVWGWVLGFGMCSFYVITTYALYRTFFPQLAWITLMSVWSICILITGIRFQNSFFDLISFIGVTFTGTLTIIDSPEWSSLIMLVQFIVFVLLLNFRAVGLYRKVLFYFEVFLLVASSEYVFSITDGSMRIYEGLIALTIGVGMLFCYDRIYGREAALCTDERIQVVRAIGYCGTIIAEISLMKLTALRVFYNILPISEDPTFSFNSHSFSVCISIGVLSACVLCFMHTFLWKNRLGFHKGITLIQFSLILITWTAFCGIFDPFLPWDVSFYYKPLKILSLSIFLILFSVSTKSPTVFLATLVYYFTGALSFTTNYSKDFYYEHPLSFFLPILLAALLVFLFHWSLKRYFYTKNRKILVYFITFFTISGFVNQLFYFMKDLFSGYFLDGIAMLRMREMYEALTLSWMDTAFAYSFVAVFLCIVSITNYTTDWNNNKTILVLTPDLQEKDSLLTINRVISTFMFLTSVGLLQSSMSMAHIMWRVLICASVITLLGASVIRKKRTFWTRLIDLIKGAVAAAGISTGLITEPSMRWGSSIALILLSGLYMWYGCRPYKKGDTSWVKEKRIIRVFGLILLSVSFVKLILWDFKEVNGYIQAISYIAAGLSCYGIMKLLQRCSSNVEEPEEKDE